MIPALLDDFWKTCPARCSLALCHGYLRPLPPPLWGSFAARFFFFLYFLSSYLSSHYHLIQENLRDHRDEKGAKWDSKRKKRKISRKLKRKSLYSPFLKGEKGKKVSKSKLIVRFRYIFLPNSLVFSSFLLISY